ncbi:hypothetical protein ACWG8W_03625 [Citricoccus zhacaiensis]
MTTDLHRRRPRTSTPTAARDTFGTEPRTASRAMSTGLPLRAAGLLAASTLVLTGCVSINVDGKASESPASSGAAADEGFVALTLPEQDFPVGTVLSKEESLVAGAPFTMNLNLTGFTPEGECAVLLDGINAFETQAVQGVTAVYEADLEAVNTTGSAAPSVQLLVAQTAGPMEIMGIYSELPAGCGTLESDEQAGATATFEQLGGLDATYLTISDGQGGESALVAGGRSLGDHHVYGVLSGVSRGDAEAILQAQADHVEALMQDSGDTV